MKHFFFFDLSGKRIKNSILSLPSIARQRAFWNPYANSKVKQTLLLNIVDVPLKTESVR